MDSTVRHGRGQLPELGPPSGVEPHEIVRPLAGADDFGAELYMAFEDRTSWA